LVRVIGHQVEHDDHNDGGGDGGHPGGPGEGKKGPFIWRRAAEPERETFRSQCCRLWCS
jgi:hypothetical protein